MTVAQVTVYLLTYVSLDDAPGQDDILEMPEVFGNMEAATDEVAKFALSDGEPLPSPVWGKSPTRDVWQCEHGRHLWQIKAFQVNAEIKGK
jgi:hypothetical protein